MQHFLLESALGICFNIFARIHFQINGLTAQTSVEEDSGESPTVRLILFTPNFRHAFASMKVDLHTFTMEKENLSIMVFAETDQDEMEGYTSFLDVDIQSIIDQYAKLKPIITEGMINYVDDLTDPRKPVRKVKRTMKVRFRILDEDFEEDEGVFNYDSDEIAESTIPYLKSLLEIQAKYIDETQLPE